MKLKSNWKDLCTKAYSVRWMIGAFLLTVAEVALPLWAPIWMPPGIFAGLSGLATAGAFVARLLAQTNLPNEP